MEPPSKKGRWANDDEDDEDGSSEKREKTQSEVEMHAYIEYVSFLSELTEGIRERSLAREGEALLEKWEKTGLLEGLGDDTKRSAMSRLLENQAAQVLREANSLSTGGGNLTNEGNTNYS